METFVYVSIQKNIYSMCHFSEFFFSISNLPFYSDSDSFQSLSAIKTYDKNINELACFDLCFLFTFLFTNEMSDTRE